MHRDVGVCSIGHDELTAVLLLRQQRGQPCSRRRACGMDEQRVPRREQRQHSRKVTNEQQSDANRDVWGSGSPSRADRLRNYCRLGRGGALMRCSRFPIKRQRATPVGDVAARHIVTGTRTAGSRKGAVRSHGCRSSGSGDGTGYGDGFWSPGEGGVCPAFRDRAGRGDRDAGCQRVQAVAELCPGEAHALFGPAGGKQTPGRQARVDQAPYLPPTQTGPHLVRALWCGSEAGVFALHWRATGSRCRVMLN